MGTGHDHGEGGHAHNHTAGANARSLAIALGLTGTFLVAELVGAWLFNSLALLSDAAHMFTDSAALAIALAANVVVALMFYRWRTGDANMRSVWICSRNDAIGNLAVLAAALGVFGTGQGWPDLAVAAIMAGLAIWGSFDVFRQARGELRGGRVAEAS